MIILIETLYMLIITGCSIGIFLQTKKLYNFSRYKGLKYYSNAFLFLSVGFLIRYLVMILRLSEGRIHTIQEFGPTIMIMEFFLMLPGLFFLYSLIWQNLEKKHYSKKDKLPAIIIYLTALALALGDMLLQKFYLMYSSQIIVFTASSILTFRNYNIKKTNPKQLFFISMILFLIVWIINLIAQYTIDIIPMIRLYAYLFTAAAVLILLYISIKLTSDFK